MRQLNQLARVKFVVGISPTSRVSVNIVKTGWH